jgi:exopolysaccharide biosynthesis WecB/TagA/CpsF family protein
MSDAANAMVTARCETGVSPTKNGSLLGVDFDNLRGDDALARLFARFDAGLQTRIFFLNVDCLRIANRNETYRQELNDSELLLLDGVGIKLSMRLHGQRMVENLNGTDFSPRVLEAAARRRLRVFLFGSRPGIAAKAGETFERDHPGFELVGTRHGYDYDSDEVVREINESGADILFVGFGAPLQEHWITQNMSRLKPRLLLGVGALFDYNGGHVPRAPRWMSRMHLEWLWRMTVDPKRLVKRYLVDGLGFLAYVAYRSISDASGRKE